MQADLGEQRGHVAGRQIPRNQIHPPQRLRQSAAGSQALQQAQRIGHFLGVSQRRTGAQSGREELDEVGEEGEQHEVNAFDGDAGFFAEDLKDRPQQRKLGEASVKAGGRFAPDWRLPIVPRERPQGIRREDCLLRRKQIPVKLRS